ncbi:MAG TPA: hypothetical protein VGL93_15860 [Streptosporangiaceae bacterium]
MTALLAGLGTAASADTNPRPSGDSTHPAELRSGGWHSEGGYFVDKDKNGRSLWLQLAKKTRHADAEFRAYGEHISVSNWTSGYPTACARVWVNGTYRGGACASLHKDDEYPLHLKEGSRVKVCLRLYDHNMHIKHHTCLSRGRA